MFYVANIGKNKTNKSFLAEIDPMMNFWWKYFEEKKTINKSQIEESAG